MEINDQLLEDLLAKAAQGERLRMNLDLRNGSEDTSQRMLNALMPGTQVPVHRHRTTIETVVVLYGTIEEIFYNERGMEYERQEPAVIIEMKDGGYIPITSEDVWHF